MFKLLIAGILLLIMNICVCDALEECIDFKRIEGYEVITLNEALKEMKITYSNTKTPGQCLTHCLRKKECSAFSLHNDTQDCNVIIFGRIFLGKSKAITWVRSMSSFFE